jgi:predicted nucleotidyltransferase component of viral defense system
LEATINGQVGKAPPKDREALFNETAAKKGISPEIVEKDFWVCWALLQVSRLTDLPRLIFKGGTSLSKAFGIIKRFSEDIDLVINRLNSDSMTKVILPIRKQRTYETELSRNLKRHVLM